MTDRTDDELCGWAFVIEMPEALEVEELFVRPRYRRRRYGTELATEIDKLREKRAKPLAAWIPHADLIGAGSKRILDRLGLTVGPSPERWASELAVHDSRIADAIRRRRPPPHGTTRRARRPAAPPFRSGSGAPRP